MKSRSKIAPSDDLTRALWKALRGVLIGAALVFVLMMAYAYDHLNFAARPRISAMIILLGFGGYLYAVIRLGAAILAMRSLWVNRRTNGRSHKPGMRERNSRA
jgi:hypothetical protein